MLMNTFLPNWRGAACFWCALLIFSVGEITSRASEYEVEGKIHQVITEANGYREETTNEFTVSVRDCGWLIQIVEQDKNGNSFHREVGSTNGTEIFDLVTRMGSATQKKGPPATAIIISNNIPVGFLDRSVVGHLWLMFASQCYWGTLKSDMLTPVFNWKASAGANPDLKVRAQWQLLNGPGSLPHEVDYLGEWDETNGLYTVTGTESVGQTIIPKSFIFEERYAVAMKGMVLRKRVEAEVSTVRATCSSANLLPVPDAKTVDIDFRLVTDKNAAQLPTYQNPANGKWVSVEEARKIAPPIAAPNPADKAGIAGSEKTTVIRVIILTVFLLPPLVMLFMAIKKRISK
jgi:hypothetical protein